MGLRSAVSRSVLNLEFLQPSVVVHAADPMCMRLALTGEVGSTTAPGLLTAVGDVLTLFEAAVDAVDLAAVTFLDASGIRCLLSCRAMAWDAGVPTRIVDPLPSVFRVLEITGLLEMFDIATVAKRVTPFPTQYCVN